MNQSSSLKTVTYQSSNSYETLNKIGPKTKFVWIVFHGMGYLSKYFLKYFRNLDPEENYIICPQAPSKYYLKEDFKHVGASWLTKEETQESISNVFAYLDAVWAKEGIAPSFQLLVFGYSQGVSIAGRWVAQRKIKCDKLIFYAGSIPTDLRQSDFKHLSSKTLIFLIYGESDEYISAERIIIERKKIKEIFGNNTEEITFKGGHEIKMILLQNLINP